ncbi:peptidase M22, glycoprotease [Aureobasidium subglaciale]|nr:peptidase M22, glycoprotease [Aureobasidium subglaciale]
MRVTSAAKAIYRTIQGPEAAGNRLSRILKLFVRPTSQNVRTLMLSPLRTFTRAIPLVRSYGVALHRRTLLTLAIETSCDDTSVAIVEKHKDASATLHFHKKVTANTAAYNGIHPVVALESHQSSLAPLLQEALTHLPPSQVDSDPRRTLYHGTTSRMKPDFISATRGPGMRSNLSVGLDAGKALAVAWDIPVLGIHHMQAHALTPRLVSALESRPASGPNFPFLSALVSGGHSMLIESTGLTDHRILATTGDIALGDCLDKAARAILPPHLVVPPYGRALEQFAFPGGASDYHYTAPAKRDVELARRVTKWGWGLGAPLAESKNGSSSRKMVYSFSGLLSSIERFVKYEFDHQTSTISRRLRQPGQLSNDERRDMAREVMRVAFEHLASRVLLYLSSLPSQEAAKVSSVVVSGGVAANSFLRHVMRSFLDVRGYQHVELWFPPIELCTDNAAMIGWAGIEMWEAGWRSQLSVRPIKTWSMDPSADDGGILGVEGWLEL